MPHALVTLPDVYESVTRRVAVTATEQLAKVMRLPGDTQVYLPGNTESVPMNGGSFGECWDPKVRYPAEARLVVRYNESINEDNVLAVAVNKPQHMPLFHDEHRDIVIRPVYRYVALAITLEYTAPNITIAQRWVDEMRSRISMYRAELYQDLEYHYAIPEPVWTLLHHLHDTMESSTTPTGKAFDEWFEASRMTPVKTATTLAGTSPTKVIPEHQYEVLGWFDFTATPPTPEKDSHDSGSYTSSITYTLHYNRPVQMYCQYPILIHNNPVDAQFRPEKAYETFKTIDRKVSTRKGSFDAMLAQMDAEGVPYIHYPDFDDWVPKFVPSERLTFFTGLLMITPDDPYTLIDLSNLGDMMFSPFFLEYFYTQGDKIFDRSDSIFEFRLYENNTLRTIEKLTLDGVTVKSKEALDPTKYYHLQISLKRNWTVVSQNAIQCLRRYPTVTYWALRAVGVKLADRPLTMMKTLGNLRPRPVSDECPGEGSIIGPPQWTYSPPNGVMDPPKGWEDWPGGTWPWPWLGEEWVGITWPGSVPDGWLETPWPEFSYSDTDGGNNDTVIWPGIHYPGHGSFPTGVITDKDIQDAVQETGNNPNGPIDRWRVGPMTVMYSEILTRKVFGK